MLHKAYNFHITPNIVLECLKPRLIVVSLTFPNSKWLDPSTCQPLKITTLAYLLWINGSHAPSMVGNEKTTRKWWLDDMASYTYKIFEHQVYPLVFFVETYIMQPIFVVRTSYVFHSPYKTFSNGTLTPVTPR